MTAYLLRFDDICPTMNWSVWHRIESILRETEVRPIMAIVPDNRDHALKIGPPSQGFWDAVRAWEAGGWTIAIHGHHHVYMTEERGMCGRFARSEFSGLPPQIQQEKLAESLHTFKEEGVNPKIWTAPSSSFDGSTLQALRELGIRIINEGMGLWPFEADGFIWIPQQQGVIRKMPLGVWTIALHHNRWGSRDVDAFETRLKRIVTRTVGVEEILDRYGRRASRARETMIRETMLGLSRARARLRYGTGSPMYP